jgi:BRCT domain type II-containing protein
MFAAQRKTGSATHPVVALGKEVIETDGVAAPNKLELQLTKRVWRVVHGPTAWRAACVGVAGRKKGCRGDKESEAVGENAISRAGEGSASVLFSIAQCLCVCLLSWG